MLPIKNLLIGLSLLVASGSLVAIELPDMGSSADSVLSPQDSQRLGEAFMRQVRKHLTLVDDPEIILYLQTLGERLVQNSTLAGQHFTFFLVKDRAINAFAAPGGFIGIHTGLILATQAESELAGVLAHEISHITQNHLSRSIESAGQLNIPMAVALVAALLLGGDNPAAGQAALAAATAGSAQYQINFTREHEQEADSVGIDLLATSHFNPHGMTAFFSRLQKSSQYGPDVPEFLRTHPMTTNRMAESQARADQYPYQQIADSFGYRLMHAKLRSLLYDQPEQAVQEFKRLLVNKQYREVNSERYGYALSLYLAKDLNAARTEISALLTTHPDQIEFITLAAKIEQAANNPTLAKRMYQQALAVYPHNALLTQAYIDVLLLNKEAAVAYPLALQLSQQSPTQSIYQQLITACSLLNRVAEAHAYQAEYYYLQNDLMAAITQLNIALQQPGIDTFATIRWRARRETLQQEWRQAEKKNTLP